jgi:hypothetical protein
MAVSPERVAEIVGLLEQALGLTPKPKPKPKVVTSEAKVVRDADVLVSKSDPNYPGSDEGVIRVRRTDFVTLRMDLYEEQQRQRREDRLRRKALDPCRLGLWGSVDDEGE